MKTYELDGKYVCEHEGISSFGKTPVEAQVNCFNLIEKINKLKNETNPKMIIQQ